MPLNMLLDVELTKQYIRWVVRINPICLRGRDRTKTIYIRAENVASQKKVTLGARVNRTNSAVVPKLDAGKLRVSWRWKFTKIIVPQPLPCPKRKYMTQPDEKRTPLEKWTLSETYNAICYDKTIPIPSLILRPPLMPWWN